jgi:kynurenine formamidase
MIEVKAIRSGTRSLPLAALAMMFAGVAVAGTAVIDESKLVDLTYTYDERTIYWPTAEAFKLERVAHGKAEAGFFYAANNICMAEHGGTHMDAPIHFAEGKATTDQIPLASGIGPAVVVDVRPQADGDPDYRLTVHDLSAWETKHGRIPRGAIVIMHSGWGERWGNKRRYLGSDEPGDTKNLHFPGFSREAATFLVHEREIDAIAVDTASIDHGPSQDFIVHQIINGANKPAFENVANVDRLPPLGATVLALPMKIGGGSGGPTRIIALLP